MITSRSSESVWVLPPEPGAAGLARGYIQALCLDVPAETVEDALIMVSELVTNAVLHRRPAIVLRVHLTPLAIGVSVQDTGESDLKVAPRNPDSCDDRGRGLLIVDGLASDWGVDFTSRLRARLCGSNWTLGEGWLAVGKRHRTE